MIGKGRRSAWLPQTASGACGKSTTTLQNRGNEQKLVTRTPSSTTERGQRGRRSRPGATWRTAGAPTLGRRGHVAGARDVVGHGAVGDEADGERTIARGEGHGERAPSRELEAEQ